MKLILHCFYILLAKHIIPRRLVAICIVQQCLELKLDKNSSCLELFGKLEVD